MCSIRLTYWNSNWRVLAYRDDNMECHFDSRRLETICPCLPTSVRVPKLGMSTKGATPTGTANDNIGLTLKEVTVGEMVSSMV